MRSQEQTPRPLPKGALEGDCHLQERDSEDRCGEGWERRREIRDHTFSIQHVDVSSVHTEQYLAARDSIMKYTASVYIKINGQVTSLKKRPMQLPGNCRARPDPLVMKFG